MKDKQQVKSVAQYLSWALGARVDVQDISPLRSPLSGGNHENWRVRALLDNELFEFVIRIMPSRETFGFAREVLPYNLETEFLALKDLEKTDLLTPKVRGLDLEGQFLGRPAFVMEYIEGSTILEAIKSDPEAVLQSFAGAILAMNRISSLQVPSVVSRYGEPGDEPADLVGWLKAQAEKIDAPLFFQRGLKALEKETPHNRPKTAFGNGDLGPQNFIYTSNCSVAIVDWEYVGFSDPLVEIMFASLSGLLRKPLSARLA
jgi:aminoglycoside phosphotransferase (APT) family kinase protein